MLIILILHLILAGVMVFFIITRKIELGTEYIPFIVCVPIIGEIAILCILNLKRRDKCGERCDEIIRVSVKNSAYLKTLKHDEYSTNIVPVEEAMLINDEKTRRRLMLDLLHRNPEQYIDVLMVAKNNEDAETVHYATSTIAKIQRDYQLSLQNLNVKITENPNDIELLTESANIMKAYIKSGILEGHLLKMQLAEYSILLKKILTIINFEDAEMLKESIKASLSQGNFIGALEDCKILVNRFTTDEDAWLLFLEVCVEAGDNSGFEIVKSEIIQRFNTIKWTIEGKESVKFWLQGKTQTVNKIQKTAGISAN